MEKKKTGYEVLLVDDEELALLGMENGVNWEALSVATLHKAGSMKSAMRLLSLRPVDLMISDIEMPGGSGLELIRWTRENCPQVVCIFYTCHAQFSYCQDAIRLGAFDYVLKPIPYGERESVIRKGLLSAQKTKKAKDLENIWGELTQEPERGSDSPVETVKRIIAENITTEISRDELAGQVFMSPDYLTKLFKKETGMSLSEYITAKRIALARQLLETTELSIVEISRRAGFSYSSYFVRIFKKKTGITPQQYRQERKK